MYNAPVYVVFPPSPRAIDIRRDFFMAKSCKRALTFLLTLVLVFGAAPLAALTGSSPSSPFALEARAYSEVSGGFTINGVTVYRNSAPWPGPGKCFIYAQNLYRRIWGCGHDGSFCGNFETDYNMLVNLSDAERRITTENARKLISNAPLGSVVRINSIPSTTSGFNSDMSSYDGMYGHSFILVAKDSGGFTALESWDSGTHCHYYTYSDFSNGWMGSRYRYFKYIKSPKAPTLGQNINYKIVNKAVSGVGESDAAVAFAVSPDGYVADWGFYISPIKQNVAGQARECKKTVSRSGQTCNIASYMETVKAGTQYYYRIWAVVNGRTFTGPVAEFTTLPDLAAPITGKESAAAFNPLIGNSQSSALALVNSTVCSPAECIMPLEQ